MKRKTLINLYYSFVFLHPVYGVIIWGNDGVSALRKIEVSQNRVLRLITFTHLKDHARVNTLYKKLGILKIQNIYIKEVCRLMHLFHDNKLPTAYKAYFRPIRQQHNYGTRSASNQNLFLPRCNTTGGLKSIQVIGAKHWNKISEVLKKLPLNKFTKHLVSDLLNNCLEI